MAAEITAQMIKDLRERTGAGMADCKKALSECAADMEKAIEYLRKKGIASAAKKATRIAAEGTIASYLHGARIGVMVEVNCETDFVARNPDFVGFAKEVAMQVAALNPQYVSQEEIPPAVLRRRRPSASSRPRPRASRRPCGGRSSTASSPSGRRRSACSIRSG